MADSTRTSMLFNASEQTRWPGSRRPRWLILDSPGNVPAMISSSEDLEGYLQRLSRNFEPAGDAGVYLVSMGAGQPPCALSVTPPVLVAQVQVGPAPRGNDATSAQFMRRLLELNATGLLHAAFAIEGEQVVLSAALALENLDDNELQAVLADFDLALTEHVPTLAALRTGQAS